MAASDQLSHESSAPTNGHSAAHDLFVLTDEQILEIEPEAAEAPPVEQPLLAVPERRPEAASTKSASDPNNIATSPRSVENTQQNAQAGVPVLPEPPPWLAAQMKDPWTGEAAKELWNGIQQAKQEAAAYRAAFATPEDARALKELYPGGVNEARTAAERARVLDDIDRAYFGAAGKSAQEVSASRAQLAQQMLREDPAAFREMVFAGLHALEEAEKGTGATFAGVAEKTVAAVFRPRGLDSNGPRDAIMNIPPSEEGYMKSYAAFEQSANEDLERSVGATIERTLQQALPNAARVSNASGVGAQHAAPLQTRLSAAIRQDVEAALKGDRQLGEQIAQILSARRFDNETRAQVVRLIDDRARQLVPSAAKRVLNEWTHATLAAHRGNASRAGAASRSDIEPALAPGNLARADVAQGESARWSGRQPDSPAGLSSRAAQARPGAEHRNAPRSDARRVDYRKLSDEQILEL